ncbi:MAG: ABC transporter permease [Clostridia bacterium]|nr:ABC transporter permease [Clostridia bacterium]
MRECMLAACRHISRRRGRAALTVGGILVGVCMIALVCVIGQAGTAAVNSELQNMGLQGLSVSGSDHAPLTAAELAAVRAVPGVSGAMPLLLAGGSGQLGPHTFSAYIGGIDAGADQVISLEIAHGRLFHSGDVKAAALVCVVDEAVAKEAYGRQNVVGKTLTVTVGENPLELTVVGVAKAGSSLLQSVSGYLPGLVYLPYTTLQALGGIVSFDQFAVKVGEDGDTATVRRRVVAALQRQSGTTGYSAENLATQRERLSNLMDIVSWILTAVSAVSLVVAGMGMLTSMLTAVNERVREIGIKQALGAGRGRILAEFLAESLLLSAIGGVIGLLLGAAVGAAGLRLVGLPATLPWGRFFLLWGCTVGLGGLFGWYPAKKAAALRPVEALRNDVG